MLGIDIDQGRDSKLKFKANVITGLVLRVKAHVSLILIGQITAADFSSFSAEE